MNINQTWRFLYAKTSMKKAISKTGAPNSGETAFIVVHGESYSDCLRKAMQEAKFSERQLIGSLKMEIKYSF